MSIASLDPRVGGVSPPMNCLRLWRPGGPYIGRSPASAALTRSPCDPVGKLKFSLGPAMQEIRISIHVRPHADLLPRYPQTSTAFSFKVNFHARPGEAHRCRPSPCRARLGADAWAHTDVPSQIHRRSIFPCLSASYCCPCQRLGDSLAVGCVWPCIARCGGHVGLQRSESSRGTSEIEASAYGHIERPYYGEVSTQCSWVHDGLEFPACPGQGLAGILCITATLACLNALNLITVVTTQPRTGYCEVNFFFHFLF
ncbi:hypothetical protein C8Q73DRAFT_673650, partial [Cubamyces lactineus]